MGKLISIKFSVRYVGEDSKNIPAHPICSFSGKFSLAILTERSRIRKKYLFGRYMGSMNNIEIKFPSSEFLRTNHDRYEISKFQNEFFGYSI